MTTFVIDMDGTSATAHVTQGKPPRDWLERGEGASKPKRDWGEAQTGFTLSGGAGFSTFSRAVNIACGDVSACESNNFGIAFSFGADYWFKRFLGVAATYIQPADVTVNGTGTGFRFNSEMKTRMVTVNAKVGGVAGPARMWHRRHQLPPGHDVDQRDASRSRAPSPSAASRRRFPGHPDLRAGVQGL